MYQWLRAMKDQKPHLVLVATMQEEAAPNQSSRRARHQWHQVMLHALQRWLFLGQVEAVGLGCAEDRDSAVKAPRRLDHR